MIEWKKRAKKFDRVVAEGRRWESKCELYRVEEVDIKYGRTRDKYGNYLGYPVFFRSLHKRCGHWVILSEHRKRGTAIKQCEYYEAHGELMPKKTKATKAARRAKAKRKARKARND